MRSRSRVSARAAGALVAFLLVALGAQAERYFTDDPTTSLMKLRQFAEVLAQRAAANLGLYSSQEQSQADLIRALDSRGVLTAEVPPGFRRSAANASWIVYQHCG